MDNMKLLDSLKALRRIEIYVPDISLEEALKNEAYVLYVDLPRTSRFLEVAQIEDPLNSIMPLQGRTQLAYVWMVDASTEERPIRWYCTGLLPDTDFPWHGPPSKVHPIVCTVLGISTHAGAVVTHVRTQVEPRDYRRFEAEIEEMGYRLIGCKRYDRALALANFYRANSEELQNVVARQAHGKPSK